MKSDKSLIEAVFNNNLSEAERLLNAGANVNCIDEESEQNPLLIAVKNNSLDMAELLLKNNADPNINADVLYTLPLIEAVDSSVQIPLYNAKIKKYPFEMIELLLKYGADIFLKDKGNESAYDFSDGYNQAAHELFRKHIEQKH